MDIYAIRKELKTKSIYDVPLRVTFYARVSTDSDEQINSLENQILYYKNFITKNSNWTFVEGYIDEGLSGMHTAKRENFHRMIDDAKMGKFDLIITKEISRFARNTLDSIQFTRQLLNDGVCVFFQNDGINTIDEDSELRLTIMSGIAQDELRKLSSRIRFGHQQAIKRNVVLGNSRIFGYQKDHKRLVVDEEQSIIVRELFELYATNQYSMKQIEKIFWDKGYRNTKGNLISHSTMSNIISNPKYKGYYVGNKVKIVDMFTKKQKFLPEDEWVMFKDETGSIVPSIVSEELWERANEVLKSRSLDVKGRQGICNHSNLLTGKIYCEHCHAPYYRKASSTRKSTHNSTWICSSKKKMGSSTCPSFSIHENEIKQILFHVFGANQLDVDKIIDDYLKLYQLSAQDSTLSKDIQSHKDKIDLIQKKRMKLLEHNASGLISDQDFILMNQSISAEMAQFSEALEKLEQKQQTLQQASKDMQNLKKMIKLSAGSISNEVITRDFVEKYIDRIVANPIDDTHMNLDIYLKLGYSCKTQIVKNNNGSTVPTGHTFKKIYPIGTITFERECRWVQQHKLPYTYFVRLILER